MKKVLYLLAAFLCCFSYNAIVYGQCPSITMIAGLPGSGAFGGDGGPATAARFNGPTSVCSDRAGNIYVLDALNYRIRKIIAATGNVITVAGTGSAGYSGDGGPAVAAQINTFLSCIAADDRGNIYLTDYSQASVRKINSATGIITTIAGAAGGSGSSTYYPFWSLAGIAVDSSGNVFVGEMTALSIFKIDTSGAVSFYCGDGTGTGHFGDGAASSAILGVDRYQLCCDRQGNVYFTDGGAKIRKIDGAGNLTTLAGNGELSYDGDGGPATASKVQTNSAFASDSIGNVYFGQLNPLGINVVRKITVATGRVNTVVGSCGTSFPPNSLAISSSGRILAINGLAGAEHCIFEVGAGYSDIATAWDGDSVMTAACNIPVTASYGIQGVIAGVPGATDSAHLRINYGDGEFTDTTLAYWSAVVSGSTVYGFGAISNWIPPHTYTYPGVYRPSFETRTQFSFGDYFFPPAVVVRSACDTNIYEMALTSIEDSVVSAPCVYPVNVRVKVHGVCSGYRTITDSVYFKVDFMDGYIGIGVMPLDTTTIVIGGRSYYSFTYTTYHSYTSSSIFNIMADAISNNGITKSSTGIYGVAFTPPPALDLTEDCGSSGYIVSSLTPADTSHIICALPYSDTFNVVAAVHYGYDTLSMVAYYINFGDGTDDTVYASPSTDGYGHYYCKVRVPHTYTMPGIYTSAINVVSPSYTGYGDTATTSFTLGSSCSALSGRLFRDANSNCGYDAGETPLGYWPIAIINNTLGDTTYYWCDTAGGYALSLINGDSYTIMPDYFGAFSYGYDSFRIACPASGIYTITPSAGTTYTQDFAFDCYGSPSTMDMNVSGWGYGFVPGDTGVITIWASHPYTYLCDSLTSSVTLTLDTTLTYLGMWGGPAPTSSTGHTYTWLFSTLADRLELNAQVKVVCHTTASLGDTIRNTLQVSPTTTSDPDMSDNTYSWAELVQSSWNPV
jgi:hypothetical protein